MPALAAVTVSATPHAPGGRDCPPRHLPDAPRELGLVAVSRHLKYSALCATVVSRDFNPTSTPSPRHTPSTRRPLPAGEDDDLGPLLGPLCCSSELRRLGDPSVEHVRPGRSIGGCSAAAPAPARILEGTSTPQNTPSTRHILKLVSRRCRDGAFGSTPSRDKAVGWAVLLVSTSVEVCVARERVLGPEMRRSRRQACRALCYAARRRQRCVPRSLLLHFGCHAFFAFYSASGRSFCSGLGEVW